MWLKFVGVTDVHGIVVEKTLFGPDGQADRTEAIKAAHGLAQRF
jgi:FMN-dependent NADH-azoreductase